MTSLVVCLCVVVWLLLIVSSLLSFDVCPFSHFSRHRFAFRRRLQSTTVLFADRLHSFWLCFGNYPESFAFPFINLFASSIDSGFASVINSWSFDNCLRRILEVSTKASLETLTHFNNWLRQLLEYSKTSSWLMFWRFDNSLLTTFRSLDYFLWRR